jgi:malonyl-CoA O-methyltransferase
MPDDASTNPVRQAQPEALAAITRRMARAVEPPWLHGEVARRMAERLALIRQQPRTLADWWSFNGASRDELQRAYPRARMLRVEDATAPADAAPWWSRRRWGAPAARALRPNELQPGSADLLWSNMMLHLVADPLDVMRHWQRALAVDGLLMFSTLGPGSLAGLRRVYAVQHWPSPHAPFVDMHDLGDMLVRCGFADPVMDQETLTLTWPDADALLRELHALGGNADPARAAGLRTPRWRERLGAALQSLRGPDGRLRLDFELVYGHAWRAAPKARVAAQTSVALDDMRAMVRAGRRAPGGDESLG